MSAVDDAIKNGNWQWNPLGSTSVAVGPGQTALTDAQNPGLAATFTKGTPEANAYAYAWNDFRSEFGRNPTQNELDQVLPTYVGNRQDLNIAGGKALVAQMASAAMNTPTNIAAQQNKQNQEAYTKGQSGFDATTNAAFQQAIGRNATPDELAHFGSLLATNQIDSYGLTQLIGTTQEAQQAQTQKYQNQLSTNLQSTQGDYFKNYIEPNVLSQSAAAGRDPNSSGVINAGVQAGQQQNYQLQNYLAQFGAGQYSQSAQNQQGVYQQYLNNVYGLQNANVTQALGQQNYLTQNNNNLNNYYLQQQAYQNYLNNYGKRNVAGGILSGAASGASAGGAMGWPWGALGGGIAGGFLGGYGANNATL